MAERWEPVIQNVHWVLLGDDGEPMVEGGHGGYPYLWIDFADGTRGEVDHELKLLRMGYPAVFLGPSFEDKTSYTLPPDPDNGREQEHVLKGFTNDPQIVLLAKEFMAALEEGTFLPQTLLKAEGTFPEDNDESSSD